MLASQRAAIFARWRELNPSPTTELHYSSPFQLLIAVILSAQSTDVGVNKATKLLFDAAPDAAAMAALGESGIVKYIKSLGLYKSKAKHLLATSRLLLERHDGMVPTTRLELEALPGVGRKTANVVLNTAFDQPTIAVDTHIFRVANRTGLGAGKTPRAVEDVLLKNIPADYLQNAHHWLILHGRYVCKARKPACQSCQIVDLCQWSGKASYLPVNKI